MAAVDHPPVTARTRRLLTTLLVPLLALLVVGAASVWPTGKATTELTRRGTSVGATVTALRQVTCTDTAPAAGVRCTRPLADLDDGGTVALQDQAPLPDLAVGDHVVLRRELDADGTPTYRLAGYDRTNLLVVLAVATALLVLLVARRRGLGVLVALALSAVVVRAFTIPAAFRDADPLVVGLVTGGAVAVLLLALRRPSARVATALVGSLGGVAVAGVLATAVVGRGHLGGIDADVVSDAWPAALYVAGMVAAAAGVAAMVALDLVDGTWDLRDAPTDARWWGLLGAGLRRSAERVASALATFALATLAGSLAVLAFLSGPGASDALDGERIATLLVTVLVGTIAIAATALVTASLAALVAVREAGTTAPGDPRKFRAKAERELWEDGL